MRQGHNHNGGSIPHDLERLDRLGDWEIHEGDRDPRGYDLMGAGGEKVGQIKHLLASPSTGKVYYAVVETDGLPRGGRSRSLLPLDAIQIGEDGRAYCPFTLAQFAYAPQWQDSSDPGAVRAHHAYWTRFFASRDAPTDSAPDGGGSQSDGGRTVIPIAEEQFTLSKRPVSRGGVRIRTRVVEQPVEGQVTLREERITGVERRPADRPLSEEDVALLRQGTIVVPAVVEEPVVSRRAHVVEEVVVTKETAERNETVRDTVRRTQVDVDTEELDAEDEVLEASRRQGPS